MKKLRCIALIGIAFCFVQEADARSQDLRGNADGATVESAVAAVKGKLIKACKRLGGISDPDSFRISSEDKIVHPEIRRPFQVEAGMKCEIQGDGVTRRQVANNT